MRYVTYRLKDMLSLIIRYASRWPKDNMDLPRLWLTFHILFWRNWS